MATRTSKTKDQLLKELEDAHKKLKLLSELETKVNHAIDSCIDEYDLDLCDEGLEAFCKKLGVERKRPKGIFTVSLTINIKEVELEVDRYGEAFDADDLSASIMKAISGAIPNEVHLYDVEIY